MISYELKISKLSEKVSKPVVHRPHFSQNSPPFELPRLLWWTQFTQTAFRHCCEACASFSLTYVKLRFIPYSITFGISGTRLIKILNFGSQDIAQFLLQVFYTLDAFNVQ